jgi:FkbM family methyltransferase
MSESLTAHAQPEALSGEHGASPSADGSSLEKLWTAVGENALLAGQVDQAIISRLLQLESRTREAEAGFLGRIERLLHDLDGRIEGLTERIKAAHSSGDRVVAQVGNDLWLTKVLNRFLMFVESSDMSVAPSLVMDGYWEKVITGAFTARLKPGLTVVDVGANYGYYSLLAAATVGTSGRVYAFEPNPRTFEVLMKNIHVNWFDSIVSARRLAALNSRKNVQLHALCNFQGSSSLFVPLLVPEADPPPEQRPVVEAAPLDDFIPESVDLMKIDAEGSEPLVFEGMPGILNRSPHLTIFMEFSVPMIRQSTDPRNFLNRIRELGFSLQWFTPWNSLELFDEEKALQFDRFDLLLERK